VRRAPDAAGRAGGNDASTDDWMDVSVDLEFSDTANFLDNPNDVVNPYEEDLFKIRIKEVIQGG
jgi:hypothetical protein